MCDYPLVKNTSVVMVQHWRSCLFSNTDMGLSILKYHVINHISTLVLHNKLHFDNFFPFTFQTLFAHTFFFFGDESLLKKTSLFSSPSIPIV